MNQFHGAVNQTDTVDTVDISPGKSSFTGVPPGWLVDPSGRHEKRFWSGSEWTQHVTDGGVPGVDSPPATGRPSEPGSAK